MFMLPPILPPSETEVIPRKKSMVVTGRFSSMRRFDLALSICAPFQHLFLVKMAQIITFRCHLKANGT